MGTGKKLARAQAEMRGLKLEVVSELSQSRDREQKLANEVAFWTGRYYVMVGLAWLLVLCWAVTAFVMR